MDKKSVCVVVLGDVGRSPRMQYHSLSLAKEGFKVNIIGYRSSEPISELRSCSDVKLNYINEPPNFNIYFPRLISYVLKVFWQAVVLFFALFKQNSEQMIIQNPPCIPTLGVCWLYSRLTNTRYIVDWHNFGFSILSLSLGKNHLLVRISYLFEKYFGKKADLNFCVSNAMKDFLLQEWGIKAEVLYDKPSSHFRKLNITECHSLFLTLSEKFIEFSDDSDKSNTRFTEISPEGDLQWKLNRPALLISSTSWTEDEDFSVLLEALEEYEEKSKNPDTKLPNLLCVITGKGPQKAHYCELIAKKNLKNVAIVTPWLEAEDYPKLLACADLGVSLHKSSSGLDLPMKVIDMFGCGLPVCAFNFPCLNELVIHKKNGLVFETSEELAEQLQFWFQGFPLSKSHKSSFHREVDKFGKVRWHENWMSVVYQKLIKD